MTSLRTLLKGIFIESLGIGTILWILGVMHSTASTNPTPPKLKDADPPRAASRLANLSAALAPRSESDRIQFTDDQLTRYATAMTAQVEQRLSDVAAWLDGHR